MLCLVSEWCLLLDNCTLNRCLLPTLQQRGRYRTHEGGVSAGASETGSLLDTAAPLRVPAGCSLIPP